MQKEKQRKQKKSFRPRFKENKKRKIKDIIKKEKTNKKGITSAQINHILTKSDNFLGCFAQDELSSLVISSLPVYLVINFDNSYSSGNLWIALRIDKTRLEIFDPLGFNSLRWPSIPHLLLNFLNKFSFNRRILKCKEVQPYSSTLCGFYCIFFIIYRSVHTFSDCNRYFSNVLKKNDKILLNFFNKF